MLGALAVLVVLLMVSLSLANRVAEPCGENFDQMLRTGPMQKWCKRCDRSVTEVYTHAEMDAVLASDGCVAVMACDKRRPTTVGNPKGPPPVRPMGLARPRNPSRIIRGVVYKKGGRRDE